MSFWIRAHRTFGLLPIDRLPASQSDGISIFDANVDDAAVFVDVNPLHSPSATVQEPRGRPGVRGVVTQILNNLLTSLVSGLMGLGFILTRFVDVQSAQALEPGRTFNLGAVNTSLYTGDIDYQPIPEGQEGYWIQELAGLTVNGQPVTLDAGSASYAAIDTGTTRVGGPADSTSALYAQIPGSETLTGDNTGYYTYPCDTNVTVTIKFGDHSNVWPILNADFLLMQVSENSCVAGFFQLDTSGTSAPPWIIGDTFVKNVYSVFRASPVMVITGSRSMD
ncbi:acid protease [Lentinus brumalis]|uniref:Acid protease n=1 Tax=Lentinus brumalis TaxID=2498619 RepID=A0A371DAU4_9APHY|nr:acid protease [Polyporus brumalis]